MDRFQNKILKFIRDNKLIQRGDCVTVGFSGGADSVCLFTLLHDLKKLLGIELQAVHVNHNLRGEEALRDEEFCRKLTGDMGERFHAVSVDVTAYATEYGLTEEEAGRILRYEALEEHADEFRDSVYPGEYTEKKVADDSEGKAPAKSDNTYKPVQRALIAVAHHADDQAETVLMNLMRGTGLKGLCGMSVQRDNIIRPLLGVSRADIVAYLASRGISYVDDSTNFENEHTRNRLRNIIIPELKSEVNAAASEHIAFSAGIIREAEDFISDEARKFADRLGEPEHDDEGIRLKLNQSELKEKARILRIYVIIEALKRLRIPLKDWGEKHFYDIDEALFKNKGHHVDLPGNVYAENVYKETYICIREQYTGQSK